MGGLLDTFLPDYPPQRIPERRTSYNYSTSQVYPRYENDVVYNYTEYSVHRSLKPVHEVRKTTQVITPSRLQLITKEPPTDLKQIVEQINGWTAVTEEYKITKLDKTESEYQKLSKLFLNSTKKHLVEITSILKIENPYLMGCYILKKNELCMLYNSTNVTEKFLFHGTQSMNIVSICKNNFDWKRHGDNRGHIFGKGISFSPLSYYASNYCDKKTIKQLLVVKVLVAKSCVGNKEMNFPPYYDKQRNIRYDTSQKENGDVYVKYYNDECYPAYIIKFRTKPGYYTYKKK